MSENRAFRVEVTIDAGRETVWQALTDPVEIRRWHGWDYDGIDDEIRYIYVDHASHVPMERIQLDEGDESGDHSIEVEQDGPRTIVRAVRAGAEAGSSNDYDDVEEGWRAFFQQLRHYLERHCGAGRRTMYLEGTAVPSKLVAAVHDRVPGGAWHEGRFQRSIATKDYGGGLVLLDTTEPIACDDPAGAHLTVTTHGLDDEEFSVAREDLLAWWSSQVDNPTAVP